jgi:Rad52/22 family double-strand break repair protein
MGFSAKQVQALRRNPDHRHIRSRTANGRELSYIEGWYAISQANRIFGFDGWSRETVESRCVLARENRGIFLAIYTAKVRITVEADGTKIIREGHGSGEGRANTPGEVHDIALKSAETDATKRALATFGRPFGLELYRRDIATRSEVASSPLPPAPSDQQPRFGWHPDDTTPIPRPSHYYGRRHHSASRGFFPKPKPETSSNTRAPPIVPPVAEDPKENKIDKSQLAIGEPKRLRDKAHLKFVASQPCLVCGRTPSDPHHLRFAQPRAIGLKVSDEFTVPLCRGHHRELHRAGNESAWWESNMTSKLRFSSWNVAFLNTASSPERGQGKHDAESAVIRWCFADASLAAEFASKFAT